MAPEPAEPFRTLTLAIWERYPTYPPYEGRHRNIVPHVSVAQLQDERELDRIEEEFVQASRSTLPIRATAGEVALIETRSGRWQVHHTFRLSS